MSLSLVLCLLPLLVVMIILKFAFLVTETAGEVEHVKEEASREHTYMENVYDDVDREDKWSED